VLRTGLGIDIGHDPLEVGARGRPTAEDADGAVVVVETEETLIAQAGDKFTPKSTVGYQMGSSKPAA